MISVVIPTFNRAYSLPRAINSVLQQKLEEFQIEVLIVDDGSGDQTPSLLAEQFPKVKYIQQDNKGVSAARNLGIEQAKGEWIALLDSDDEWLPGKLAAQMHLLQETELLVCHTEEIWIRNDVRVNPMNKHQKKGGWIYQNCLPMCVVSPSSIVIHRSVFDSVGRFDETLPACEDYDLWLRICCRFELAFVEHALLKKYGGHDDQLSRQHWGMDRFRVRALEKMLDLNELDAEQRSATQAMLVKKCQILLKGAIKHGNSGLEEQCRVKLKRYE